MCKLIVHADDFGLTEKVNEGILKAHLHGILTSASLMANGAAFEHAIEICHKFLTLDIGIHLTLVEEKPVLNQGAVGTLINANGRFTNHSTQFVKKYLSRKISLQEVRRELEAQIVKIKSCGVRISHIDSHQHLHILPKILKITVELAKKHNIASIRMPYEMLGFNMLDKDVSALRVIQSMFLNFLCKVGRYSDLLRTDYFVGFLLSGNLNRLNLQKVIQRLPLKGTCELMCHPGLENGDGCYSHWKYHWKEELNALIDPGISSLIQRKGISLISYKHLTGLACKVT